MNKLKKCILVLFCIILIIVLLLILLKSKFYSEDNNIIEGDPGEVVEIDNKMEPVDNFSIFKSVNQCIQQYYNVLNNNSSSFFGKDENGNYVKTITDIEINQIRLDLLSEEYKENNNININNIDKYIKTFDEQYNVVTLKVNQNINVNVNKYIAQGIIVDINNEFIDDFYIIVNLDNKNKTFSIEPISEKYNSIDEIKVDNNNETIDVNSNNMFSSKAYKYEEMAKEYLLTFKRVMLARPDIIFNNYMGSEYKNKRFGDINEFLEYVNNNRQELINLTVNEYSVNYFENYIEIIVKDQYGNLYIFDKYDNQDLYIRMDMYTIETDSFIKTYQKSDDIKKSQINVDKFFNMINRHDYRTSYNCLSKGFRDNYFKTEEEFEKYAKNRFFTYNKISFKSCEKKGNGLYVLNVELSDLTGESKETKTVSIIIQLKDNFNFEMSFST